MGDSEAGYSKRHRLSLSPPPKSKAEKVCLIHTYIRVEYEKHANETQGSRSCKKGARQ